MWQIDIERHAEAGIAPLGNAGKMAAMFGCERNDRPNIRLACTADHGLRQQSPEAETHHEGQRLIA